MAHRLRCQVGDLAVIIKAHNRCNIGLIVRVVAPYDRLPHGPVPAGEFDWFVESSVPLLWTWGGKKGGEWRSHRGPAPDISLHPLRGRLAPAGNERKKRLRRGTAERTPELA